MNSLQEKKIIEAVGKLLQMNQGKMNVLHLVKLVWAADRYHLRKYGRTITGDYYVAMKYGPVGSNTKEIIDSTVIKDTDEEPLASGYFQRNGLDVITRKADGDDYLSETDEEALAFAYDTFGNYDRFRLADLSHEYPEWNRFAGEINVTRLSAPINTLDFFDNPSPEKVKNDPFALEDDVLEFNKKSYLENLDAMGVNL